METRLLFLLLLALVLASIIPSAAGPFDSEDRDFSLLQTITGYEIDTWFKAPSAVAVDERAGIVYIADPDAGAVYGFSLQGTPRLQYGEKEGLKSPFGLAVGLNGALYVSEKDGGPLRVILSGGSASDLVVPPVEGQDSAKPGRLTVGRDGSLYLVDRASSRILVFDKDRNLKQRIGGKGDKRGQFKSLNDAAVDRQGRIYALDSLGTPVQVFDRKGKCIYRFGYRGEGPEEISFGEALFIDRNDQLWIVDRARHSIKVFDRSGAFLRSFGAYGQGEAEFFYPVDAEIDDMGRVYVLETGSRRLQIFSLKRPFEPFKPTGL